MKKKILALLSGLLLISFLFIPVLAQEGFEIDHYDVQMDIDDNGVYTVTETLDVSFFQPLHGIQLQIPKKYRNFSWTIDGQQIRRSYVFPIDHIEVLSGHEANIDDEEITSTSGWEVKRSWHPLRKPIRFAIRCIPAI